MAVRKNSRTKSLSLCDDLPLRAPRSSNRPSLAKKIEDSHKIMKYIDDNLIGKSVAFFGPFGRRKVVYADYSSSGRSLHFLEDYINKEVLPAFGDIECTSSVTGLQSQLYFNEAREIIKSSVSATSDDEIIFCDGQFKSPSDYLIYLLSCQTNGNLASTILFVSTSEPFYNLKPWYDAGVQIERVIKTREGFLDLVDLEKKLQKFQNKDKLLVGLFAAASRLTGILADDVATTILLHEYGALSFWNYNICAPNSCIDMNPPLTGALKDVIFFNASKFIGGLQAPGILIVKKHLVGSAGKFILESTNVIGAVRVGLVVQLKESIGLNAMTIKHEKICKQILSHIRTIPEIVLIGPPGTTAKRLPTICFLVRHSRGIFLHHKFVIAVLNDVFGIQASVGSHIGEALGIMGKLAVEYEQILEEDDTLKNEHLRPGYTRIYLPFFMSEPEIGYIMEALKMVATEAWKMLPHYEVDESSGDWRHHSNSLAKERKVLGAIRYTDGRMIFADRRISGPGTFPQNYSECLQTARNIFNRSRKMAQKSSLSENLPLRLKCDKLESLRWYILPGEAHKLLIGHSQNVKQSVPFDPNRLHAVYPFMPFYRHNSLSALEVKRFKSRSVPASPNGIDEDVPIVLKAHSEIPTVRFSLGGEVTTMMSLSPNRITSLIENYKPSRIRCNSWESSVPRSPPGQNEQQMQTNVETTDGPSLTLKPLLIGLKERSCSCSSQTDANSFDSDFTENHSLNNNTLQQSVTGSSHSDCTEDISAYVKEVTKELATEIKSEIRDVISKVEDVLDNTDIHSESSVLNLSALDTVSATDVAEYLKTCSKEITSEVQSEIREMVNAVDEFISPAENGVTHHSVIKQRHSDIMDSIIHGHEFSSNSTLKTQRSESYPRPNSSPGWHSTVTASCPENSTPSCPYTGAISKLSIDSNGTASHDSGINMCFHEMEENRLKAKHGVPAVAAPAQPQKVPVILTTKKDEQIITATSSSHCDSINSIKSTTNLPRKSLVLEKDTTADSVKWHNLPKEIWKPAAEAMDEYDMLQDGDKILVCLSGSAASLCLLHVLRQCSRARQIHIELGVITLGTPRIDPRVLMLYMRDLGVTFTLDAQVDKEGLKAKLTSIARRKGYNVLAMGDTLDKLADDFLMSVLYKGRVHTTKPHCIRDHDIRIIRPFIFIRERALEDFSLQNSFPSRPSTIIHRPLNASNSILKVQELINPNVYENIKNALKPLLSHKYK